MYSKYYKTVFDLIISSIFLMVLSPLFIIICITLACINKGQVFFIQSRPGINENEFKLIKFKTMNDDKDSGGNLLPNYMRITRTGRFLRNISLDEIPQLINILKGDMSLIGPRPLLFKYIPLYSEIQRKRHLVKPGITGLAQVNGRNAISWTKKLEYDVFYVENLSFALDLKILCKTIIMVIRREGINADSNITMPPFNGNN